MFVPCPVYQQQEFNKDPSKDKIADLDTVSRSVLMLNDRYPSISRRSLKIFREFWIFRLKMRSHRIVL